GSVLRRTTQAARWPSTPRWSQAPTGAPSACRTQAECGPPRGSEGSATSKPVNVEHGELTARLAEDGNAVRCASGPQAEQPAVLDEQSAAAWTPAQRQPSSRQHLPPAARKYQFGTVGDGRDGQRDGIGLPDDFGQRPERRVNDLGLAIR